MSFRKYQPELAAKKKYDGVRVKRSYYTFSKYYPAGDTNRVYRKSISSARRAKKVRVAAGICAAVAVAALIVIIAFL
ncbi:MAG: hypothetical protein MJ177_03525 [Clostridia bacterium]|nr:hypothetical protein [Clostridia bacterium]